MARNNNKTKIFDYDNSIKKSNELSMAELSHGLTLNQMQLFAYAIYRTQQDGKTEFNKSDFEKKFNLTKYNTKEAIEDIPKLKKLEAKMLSVVDEEKNIVDFESFLVFRRIRYDNGLFTFTWDKEIIPHIIDLKEKYVLTDLTITAKFNSSFSWTLYDYLKAHYGYWHKVVSKEDLMQLFGVEGVISYTKNTGLFKKKVLDFAIKEINEYTELEVRYEEKKKGRTIVGFDLIWSTGKAVASATKSQINTLKSIIDTVIDDMDNFLELKQAENQKRAVNIVRDIQSMRLHTIEPICITKTFADQLIFQANDKLRQLNLILQKDDSRESIYYNWLEEQGV